MKISGEVGDAGIVSQPVLQLPAGQVGCDGEAADLLQGHPLPSPAASVSYSPAVAIEFS